MKHVGRRSLPPSRPARYQGAVTSVSHRLRDRLPLLKRLLPSLRKRWARLTWTGGYAVVRRHNACFLLDHRNFVDRQLAFFAYEEAQLDYFLSRMTRLRADIFLDVGANFGLYSVLAVGADASRRVIAIEPDRRSLAQLEANLLLNGMLERVEIVAKAASDREGARPFLAAPATTTGQSRIAKSPGSVEVASCRLDDLVSETGRTIFVKLDVEGHEREIIAGAARLFAGNRIFLQIESFAPNADLVAQDLAGRGFRRVHRIGDDHYFANFAT